MYYTIRRVLFGITVKTVKCNLKLLTKTKYFKYLINGENIYLNNLSRN